MSMMTKILGTGVINITANTQGLQQAIGQANAQFAAFQQRASAWRAQMPTWAAAQQAGMNTTAFKATISAWKAAKPVAPPAIGAAGGGAAAGGLGIQGGAMAVTIAGVVGSLGLLAVGLKKAAEAASDYQEAVAKSEQAFGSNKGIVGAQAENLASKYGVSRRETHELSSRAGLLLQGAGVDEKASAKMGANLAKLSAEASSFFNVPVEEAMRRIQSGLSGMSRPLREFGVLITDAKVKAKAFEMGLATSNGTITDGAKVLARYALITEGLKRAEGDIERSQDRYSMQVRMLQGNWENLSAAIGETVLPVFTELLSMLNAVVSAADAMVRGLNSGFSFAGTMIASMMGLSQLQMARENADAMNADIKIDNRNKGMIQEQRQLDAAEAALKKGSHRDSSHGDIQSIYRNIQDAINSGESARLREQVEIAKKTLEANKATAKSLDEMNKKLPQRHEVNGWAMTPLF